MMDRLVGIPPAHAPEQVYKSWPKVPTQPLPAGSPARVKPQEVGIADVSPLRIVVIGDHGGVKDPAPQLAVARAMASERPDFCLSLGDVVYYNADDSEYVPQFYEPYAACTYPFVAIPGNHDGDTTDDPARQPLDTFMEHWCASAPTLPRGGEEYQRAKQTLPWCDWTLDMGEATIIGLYSNVPSGGHLEQSQIDWLAGEVAAADPKPLVVCLHHPPYSIDAHHGGSSRMGDALDGAFTQAKRFPNLILSGHVHDYQRFARHGEPLTGVDSVTYVVVGNSGYHNLHAFAPGATAGEQVIPGVVYEYGDDAEYGFLRLEIDSGTIAGEYVGVQPGAAANLPPTVTDGKDVFTVPLTG